MENKYYTPEIKEFHVGFECEILSSYDWQKGIWPEILQKDTLTGFEKNIIKATENTSIRVKYLDKDDIEKLNWIADKERTWGDRMCFYKNDNTLEYYEDCTLIINRYKKNLEVFQNQGINNIEITNKFRGKIKNISELKILLKQLDIQ